MKKNRLKKKNIFKKLIGAVLIGSLAVGVIGCGKSDKKDDGKHLNIALQKVTGYIPLYLLRDSDDLKNALKEYDVKINFTEFESGPSENESFAAGQQDIGVIGNVPAITGIAAGQDRVLVGIAYNGEKTEATLVPKDSDITKLEDLKGKKVGLVVGSIAQNLLDAQLKSVGLSIADVTLVNLSPAEQSVALENGEVDAISTWEPNITKIRKALDAKVLADGTGIFLGENPIIANKTYVEKNQELVKTFLDEYRKAAQKVKDDPQAIAKTYAEDFGLEEEDFVSALANAEFPIDLNEADAVDLQNTVDFLAESDIIEKTFDIQDYIK